MGFLNPGEYDVHQAKVQEDRCNQAPELTALGQEMHLPGKQIERRESEQANYPDGHRQVQQQKACNT